MKHVLVTALITLGVIVAVNKIPFLKSLVG